ncbi:MAG: ComF family protein, partial [Bdellovibrionales bacterium]
IKILYLLNWIPNESDSLSKLHLELKNTHPQVWKWLAQKITKTLIQQNRELFKAGEPLVVTLKSQSGYNHSESWGEAISQELGLNHITALEKETISGVNHEQKKNNRADRRGLRLKSRVDLTSLSKRPIIFADDILTTGATLKEAYRVLGEPPQFIGLFVSHRKLH